MKKNNHLNENHIRLKYFIFLSKPNHRIQFNQLLLVFAYNFEIKKTFFSLDVVTSKEFFHLKLKVFAVSISLALYRKRRKEEDSRNFVFVITRMEIVTVIISQDRGSQPIRVCFNLTHHSQGYMSFKQPKNNFIIKRTNYRLKTPGRGESF